MQKYDGGDDPPPDPYRVGDPELIRGHLQSDDQRSRYHSGSVSITSENYIPDVSIRWAEIEQPSMFQLKTSSWIPRRKNGCPPMLTPSLLVMIPRKIIVSTE